MIRGLRTAGLAFVALAVAVSAEAQAFDAPSFLPPRPGDDIGGYLSTQGDFAIQGIWRQQGNLNLGVRFGFIDYDNAFGDSDGAITVGAETWGLLIDAGPEFPLDLAWTLGVGAAFDGFTVFEVPAGITLGRTFDTDPVRIQAYGHPRVALVAVSYNGTDDTDIEFLFDLGADIYLSPEWKARIGFTLGDEDAFGAGVAYTFGRSVSVR